MNCHKDLFECTQVFWVDHEWESCRYVAAHRIEHRSSDDVAICSNEWRESTQKLTASLAIVVSAEALSAMMASPDSAVAGLEEGFAEYIGVDSEYVSVESTDPDLYGGRRLADLLPSLYMSAGRRAQSSLTVEYVVDLPPDVLAATPDLLVRVES